MKYDNYRKKALKNKKDALLPKYITRKISTRISYFLLQKYPNITPNEISFLAFIIGIISAAFFCIFNGYISAVIGAIILFLWSVLDHVDGEIARFKKMKSITGTFLEASFDFIVITLFFIGITLFLHRQLENTYIFIFGIFALSSFLLQQLVKVNFDLAFFRGGKDKNYVSTPLLEKIKGEHNLPSKKIIFIVSLIIKIEKAIFSHNIVFVVLIFSIIDFTFRPMINLGGFPITGLSLLLAFYSITLPFCFFNLIINFYRAILLE